MHGINLDLLQTTPHRANGTARDPHAYHHVAHLDALRAKRRARLRAAFLRLLAVVPAKPTNSGPRAVAGHPRA